MNKSTDRILRWFQKHGTLRTLVVIVLVFLCAFEVSSIYSAFQTNITGYFGSGHTHMIDRGATPHSANEIQSWMTFSYINFVFKLPPAYLESILPANESRYPQIQIRRYARMHHLDESSLLRDIRQAVANYKP